MQLTVNPSGPGPANPSPSGNGNQVLEEDSEETEEDESPFSGYETLQIERGERFVFELVDYIDLGETYTLHSINLLNRERFIRAKPGSNQVELRPSPTEKLGTYSFEIEVEDSQGTIFS